MGNCIGCSGKCIFDEDHDFGTGEKRDVVRMPISHVGDLLVSGPDACISYLSGKLKMNTASKFSRETDRSIWA